ncbi:unnamed protein product [Penicillium camemberti]|uniref:Str. FM013 n=1 Tax=Penicillium camemberti (strain FM 013) TaxID=1429867 RepID=A0A0G4PLV1_PENC3|nr:unnamed protein product [Penicillium camemberti]
MAHKNSQDDNEAPAEGVMTPGPLEETDRLQRFPLTPP